jgi:hypothetical protein
VGAENAENAENLHLTRQTKLHGQQPLDAEHCQRKIALQVNHDDGFGKFVKN